LAPIITLQRRRGRRAALPPPPTTTCRAPLACCSPLDDYHADRAAIICCGVSPVRRYMTPSRILFYTAIVSISVTQRPLIKTLSTGIWQMWRQHKTITHALTLRTPRVVDKCYGAGHSLAAVLLSASTNMPRPFVHVEQHRQPPGTERCHWQTFSGSGTRACFLFCSCRR